MRYLSRSTFICSNPLTPCPPQRWRQLTGPDKALGLQTHYLHHDVSAAPAPPEARVPRRRRVSIYSDDLAIRQAKDQTNTKIRIPALVSDLGAQLLTPPRGHMSVRRRSTMLDQRAGELKEHRPLGRSRSANMPISSQHEADTDMAKTREDVQKGKTLHLELGAAASLVLHTFSALLQA